MRPRDERRWRVGQARDAFVRAAEALTHPDTTPNLAAALLWGCLGVFRVAQADADEVALDEAEAALRGVS
jgi:hypothetical protein